MRCYGPSDAKMILTVIGLAMWLHGPCCDESPYPSFIGRWWPLIPLTIGADIWWVLWFDQGERF